MSNTKDILGDQQTLDGLVSGSLTSFEDDQVTSVRSYAFYGSNLDYVKLQNAKRLDPYSFGSTKLVNITSDMFPSVQALNEYCFKNCKK